MIAKTIATTEQVGAGQGPGWVLPIKGVAPGDVGRKSKDHLLAAPLDLDYKVR